MGKDSAILSPNVTVFRSGTSDGYAFRSKPYTVSVASIALPNLNPQVRDSPVEKVGDARSYEASIASILAAGLYAAALSGSTVIVIPDIGCGVFKNDPKVVGGVLGRELLKFTGYFERVVLCGQKDMV